MNLMLLQNCCIKLCGINYQYNLNYKCLMPTNTFGKNDNYNLEESHFLPALIKKIHLSKLIIKKYLFVGKW